VAQENGVALYPDLFAGVGPSMYQTDDNHPNAAGARTIAKGLAPLVVRELRARAEKLSAALPSP
jgi:lysophospholipase L1-like esterase